MLVYGYCKSAKCFADAILKETMRLNGHNMNIRKATEDTVFTTHDGKQYKFRKGDHVMYYFKVMHMGPEIFNKPEVTKYVKVSGRLLNGNLIWFLRSFLFSLAYLFCWCK